MSTQYTKRAIIIVRADVAALANTKSKLIDLVGGEFTFTVPLEATANPGVAVAYICGWTMLSTESVNLINRLKEIEATLSNKVRIFDVSGMTPEEEQTLLDQKLTLLGLQRMTAQP